MPKCVNASKILRQLSWHCFHTNYFLALLAFSLCPKHRQTNEANPPHLQVLGQPCYCSAKLVALSIICHIMRHNCGPCKLLNVSHRLSRGTHQAILLFAALQEQSLTQLSAKLFSRCKFVPPRLVLSQRPQTTPSLPIKYHKMVCSPNGMVPS